MAEFDEDEHDKDSYRKVTVTALTLTNLDTEEVVADDPVALFGGEMACVDPRSDGQSLSDRNRRRLHCGGQ